MADKTKYISQYKAPDGTVYLLKDKNVRLALQTKANAASLGVATKRIDDLEENTYTKSETYSKTETYTKTEVNDIIEGADIVDKTTRQLAIDYFLPPFREGTSYASGQVIRYNGFVFESTTDDNATAPYTIVSSADGKPIVNDGWRCLITDDVNTHNWAKLTDDDIPEQSIPEWQAQVQAEWDAWQEEMNASMLVYKEAMQKAVDDANQQCAEMAATVTTLTNRLQQALDELDKYHILVNDVEEDDSTE